MNKTRSLINVAVMTALMLAAMTQTAGASYEVTDGDGYTQVDGTVLDAPFRIVKPDDWNGELVMLLRGYTFPGSPIVLPPPGQEFIFEGLTADFVERGYAVGYSAYQQTGYAVESGAIDTRIVEQLFRHLYGKTRRIWLTGLSMGTHVGQRLVEKFPNRYAGFMAVCAALGGSTVHNDYASDVRVLFDYFYPGALPGDLLTAELDYFAQVVPAAQAALTANPAPAFELAAVLDLAYDTPEEMFQGIVTALASAGGGTADMQAKAGGNPYDNSAVVYAGSADDDALNAGVGRFLAARRAQRYLARYYDPKGTLPKTEVFHLHTTRDPLVPLDRHRSAYEALLAQQGDGERYYVRAVERYGHCLFGSDEILAAFEELASWQQTGVRPAD